MVPCAKTKMNSTFRPDKVFITFKRSMNTTIAVLKFKQTCDVFGLRHSPVFIYIYIKVKVKWSRYRPDVAHRMGRGIALLFHDRGTRRRWMVSSTPRPHFTPGKEPVNISQETGWAPGPVSTGGKSRPHLDSIPYRPARSQSLYRLSYPAQLHIYIYIYMV